MAQYEKGKVSEKKILLAGYRSIARLGYHKTTFESIAEMSGFSQARVVKVFNTKSMIFPLVANFIWQEAIQATVEALERAQTSNLDYMLKAYIEISVEHFCTFEDMKEFYLNFYYYSLYDKNMEQLNFAIREKATERITQFLSPHLSKKDKTKKAHFIHSSLTGLLINNSIEQDINKLEQDKEILIQLLVNDENK